jgi:hypothetical protein
MALAGVQQFSVAAQATREATQRTLVAVAKRKHNEVMNTDPRPARFTRTVDGRKGAVEETVKPDGIIVYDYPRMHEIVMVAMNTLFELSPVLSGEYRTAHTIYVNGNPVSNLQDWDGTSEVVILNHVPYARKIELGKMRMRVPGTDHVYEQAEYLLNQRYSNVARIRFSFRGIAGGYIAKGKAHGQSDNRWPALVISAR